MFWKNEKDHNGWIVKDKVQMYECQFTHKATHREREFTSNGRCLVVSNTVEEAIAACRARYPKEFVLHSVHKRNQRCDLIVCETTLPLAEHGEAE